MKTCSTEKKFLCGDQIHHRGLFSAVRSSRSAEESSVCNTPAIQRKTISPERDERTAEIIPDGDLIAAQEFLFRSEQVFIEDLQPRLSLFPCPRRLVPACASSLRRLWLGKICG